MSTFEEENRITVTTENKSLVAIISSTPLRRINTLLADPSVENLEMVRTFRDKWILTWSSVKSEAMDIPPTYSVFCAAVMVDDSRVQTKLCGQVENVLAHDPHYNGIDSHDFIPSKTRVNEGVVPNYLGVQNLPKTVAFNYRLVHTDEFCGHTYQVGSLGVSACGRSEDNVIHRSDSEFEKAHRYVPVQMFEVIK